MAGKKSKSRGQRKENGDSKVPAIPDIYQEMLEEALPSQPASTERPLKRRRAGRPDTVKETRSADREASDREDDEELEFEDVLDRTLGRNEDTSKPQQTAYRDFDESEDESDYAWEGVEFDMKPAAEEQIGDLELTLTRKEVPRTPISRRKAVTKAEKIARLEIHKMHVLCLLSHLHMRNTWCNDTEVQASLKPLLDKKMLTFLRPKSSLSQFGQAESLKRGLEQVSVLWRTKYSITARGMRRALWADDEKQLQKYKPPDDSDLTLEMKDFREAAKKLKGSRDLGAQLYCALLRSAGVETRLVCSLQPLSFNAGGPSMPKSSSHVEKAKNPEMDIAEETVDRPRSESVGQRASPSVIPTPRLRLGHPNAADYHMPELNTPRLTPKLKRKVIHESPYPIFWVEVFDTAHQKWFPVDPLVTESIAKPRVFEPPLNDQENNMCYAIAFEEEGCARDVTRRYTKAFNAKTRKNRVESTPGGARWWRHAMRTYSRGWHTDADQIEDGELAKAEAREPMPKNIQDFKDHPVYALERHLKRNEVLIGNHEIGKVASGRDSGTPGKKKMESIFRRQDVKIARSADAWYRLGREVRLGEQPVKTVPAKSRPDADDQEDVEDDRAGTNLYTEQQTELYEAPPIVDGRVPKNSYGNLDVFVPTMVPKGGVHLPYIEASRAARLLNIDYADALTGFEFRGRHGTAVLKGIVVASEYREAVEAVIEGLRDELARDEERIRTHVALRMWKRFLVGLRIKERVYGYQVEGEEPSMVPEQDDQGLDDDGYDEDGGGGFFPE